MSWYVDANPRSGYWGPITSSLIWCEEKYRWTKYIAEPANTLSNLFLILVSLYGVYTARREALPVRFVLTHAGVTLVGVGSTLFHMTLKYEMQLLDELPMIYTSTLLTYSVLETSRGYHSARFPLLLPLSLLLLVLFITAVYISNGNPVFHQVAYASIHLASTLRVLYLLTATLSHSSPAQKRQVTRLYAKGAAIFLSGFAIWNVDNVFCSTLREVRERVGYPAAWVLEGHAWWHLLTGYGAYAITVASSLLVVSVKERPGNFRLVPGFLPYVERLQPYSEEETATKKSS